MAENPDDTDDLTPGKSRDGLEELAQELTRRGRPVQPYGAPAGPPSHARADQRVEGSSRQTRQEDLEQDPLLRALFTLGRVLHGPRSSNMGRAYDVLCPWVNEHTDRADTGAAYVPV